jgi:cytochrome c-type biogenesis protein CcmH/NrfG
VCGSIDNPAYAQDIHVKVSLRSQQRFAEAEAVILLRLRQSLAEDSSVAGAHYALGYSLRECKDIDGAEEAFRAAIRTDPKDADVRALQPGRPAQERPQGHRVCVDSGVEGTRPSCFIY